MAKAAEEKAAVEKAASTEAGQTSNKDKYKERRWSIPSRRAKGYAEERKARVHKRGPKEGKELTDYEAGIRSGYLQAQTDHSCIYKYKKALSEGKTKEEAKIIAKTVNKRPEENKDDKKQ